MGVFCAVYTVQRLSTTRAPRQRRHDIKDLRTERFWRSKSIGEVVKNKQTFTKYGSFAILCWSISDRSGAKIDIHEICKLNLSLFMSEFGELRTDQVIITDERINHIQEHHPEDYELFTEYGADAVENPDMLILDTKNRGTVFAVKKLSATNLNVVVRLVLEGDDPTYKNSIMTFYRLRKSNLKKLIAKHRLLYTKE